jgi:hypothetical protein
MTSQAMETKKRLVSEEKEFDYVVGQIRYLNDKIIESFNFFIKVFSAVVGGSVWLTLQKGMTVQLANEYAKISDGLVMFLAILVCLMIFEHLRSWHGYRKAQSRLSGKDEAGKYYIPAPRRFRASVLEIAMMGTMITVATLFCLFNPFILVGQLLQQHA